jgi:uncharacterized iron-regulated membrane protein
MGEGGGEVRINVKQLLFAAIMFAPLFVILFVTGGIDAIFDTHIAERVSDFVIRLKKKLVG